MSSDFQLHAFDGSSFLQAKLFTSSAQCARAKADICHVFRRAGATLIFTLIKSMHIRYETSRVISETEFVDLLRRSTLGARRPVDDQHCIRAMLQHANLLCTAWDDGKLVGVARSVTDFEFCCYLSDLAVDESYQKKGIGRELIQITQSKLGRKAKIILLAAPAAETYYPKIGFDAHRSAWILPATKSLT